MVFNVININGNNKNYSISLVKIVTRQVSKYFSATEEKNFNYSKY